MRCDIGAIAVRRRRGIDVATIKAALAIGIDALVHAAGQVHGDAPMQLAWFGFFMEDRLTLAR